MFSEDRSQGGGQWPIYEIWTLLSSLRFIFWWCNTHIGLPDVYNTELIINTLYTTQALGFGFEFILPYGSVVEGMSGQTLYRMSSKYLIGNNSTTTAQIADDSEKTQWQ